VDAILPNDRKPLLPSVDNHDDLFAREASVRRAGYPRRIFDGRPQFSRPPLTEREHVEKHTRD
jgi:hypothetical protein